MDDAEMAVRAELFGSLFVVFHHLARRTDAALAPLGLTSRQWLLLAVIDRHPDHRPSLSEAATAHGTSRQNCKQIALQLERRGLIRLEPDPNDGRTTRLVLAPAAAVFADPGVTGAQMAFLDQTFADLDPDELRTLHRLVSRLIRGLAAAPDPVPLTSGGATP